MKRDEPDSSSDENANAFYYHLEKYGLWVFFDQNRTVRMIRLDAPFNGKVGGVGIGDSREAMLSRKGKPTEEIAGFNATSWVYYRTADRFVRYEISPINNKVESIMADSCRIPV
jgi:hypothetical protein